MTPISAVASPAQELGISEILESASTSPHKGWISRNRSLLLFTVLAALYILPFMWLFIVGFLEIDAVRVLHGQVPGRDFFEVMTPGTFYWNAAFMKIFGPNFLGARACLFVTSLGTAVCMYWLTRRIAPAYRWLPALILAATYFGNMWPLASHHTVSNFFALIAVVLVVYGFDHHSRSACFGAGILTTATGLTLQPKGALLLVAILLWLVVIRMRRKIPASAIIMFVAGVAVAGGAAVLYFWSKGALYAVYQANVLWPLRHYSHVNDVPYGNGTLAHWNPWFHAGHGISVFALLAPFMVAPFLYVDALPFILAAFAAWRWRESFRPVLLLYWLCGTALWLSEFHRKEIGHLVSGSPIFLILGCYFLLAHRSRASEFAIKVLAVCTTLVAMTNLLMMTSAHSVNTRVGTVLTFKHIPAIQFLDQHTSPGEYIYCFPYWPGYYFLTETRNPTRYSLLIYNYNTERQFKSAIAEIEAHRVKYIVWGTDRKELQKLLPGSTVRPPYGFIMNDYIRSHYRRIEHYQQKGIEIWERDGDD